MIRAHLARLALASCLALVTGLLALTGVALADPPGPAAASVPTGSLPAPTVTVPVLMYHHIGNPLGHLSEFEYYVTLPAFDAQMEYLSEDGFTPVSLDQVLAAMEGLTPLPPHPVAITFDDGNQDNYDLALPVLEKYHLTATFLIVTGWVGKPGHLTWDEIGAMQQAGMFFGAHTVSHPYLPFLPTSLANSEIMNSKNALESRLGQAVQVFAYPYGHASPTITRLVETDGFGLALGTSPYRIDHTLAERFYLTRYGVYAWTSLRSFERQVPSRTAGDY